MSTQHEHTAGAHSMGKHALRLLITEAHACDGI